MKDDTKRCPMCKSSNLYRRSWAMVWARKSMMRDKYDKDMLESLDKKTKKYRCINCGKEFDVPLDGKKFRYALSG